MKKIVYITAVALFAVCCNKYEKVSSIKTILVPVTAEAGVEETKTVLDDHNILFSANEQIGIWDGQEVMPFTTTEGGDRAIFEGTVHKTEGDEQPLVDTYYAIAPYSTGVTYSNGLFDIRLPHNQVAVSGGFDPAAQFGYASADPNSMSFNFTNAVAFAKIKLNTESAINLMGILDTDGTTIAGGLKLNPTTGAITVGGNSEAWPSVQFSSETSITNGTYLLALRPGTYNIQVYAETVNGDKYFSVNASSIAFTCNKIRNLGEITESKLSEKTQPGTLIPPGTSLGPGQYLLVTPNGSGSILITPRTGDSSYRYNIVQKGAAGTTSYKTYDVELVDAGDGKVFVLLYYKYASEPYAYLRMLGNRLNSYSPSTSEKAEIARVGWDDYLNDLNNTEISIWETHDGVGGKVNYLCTTKFSVYSIAN